MANITQVEVNGTTYNICDAVARDSLGSKVGYNKRTMAMPSFQRQASDGQYMITLPTLDSNLFYILYVSLTDGFSLLKSDNGTVTWPWQLQKNSVLTSTATKTLTSGVETVLTNANLTIPRTGTYLISLRSTYGVSGTGKRIHGYSVNSTTDHTTWMGYHVPISGDYTINSDIYVKSFNANDIIRAVCYQNSGSSLDVTATISLAFLI